MKKCAWILVLILLFGLTVAVLPTAASDNEAVVSFDIDGEQLELKSPENNACFWEYPTLKAGQHRSDGILRLHNDSDKNAVVTLKDFKLPVDKAEEMEYLAALKLTVSVMKNNVKEAVYTGSYADIGGMEIALDVPKGMDGSVYFEMGCDFTYEGEGKLTDSITYHIDATATTGSSPLVWILIAASGAVVLALVLLIAILIDKKKSKKSA